MAQPALTRTGPGRSLWSGVLLGIGFMAAVDEIVFHQILAWHHFYDRSTPAVSLLSDGLLHASELVALVAGMFMMADLLRSRAFVPLFFWAGLFLGLAAFQLFDGVVDHKVLQLHQVRYGVPILLYDLAWNLAGLALLLIGALLWRRASRRRRAGP
ncbi:DUF2243 domain-containing protein (plasmid) [Deinococcus metallilatus]|uniref:Membrane protein n=1 Tax=Deinococcus metallilatus TaxID=1211322 RepID=A0ABR6MYG3_9DEIO|nr:DUF2243 domain-containing protein [Deinococcus metallilatus]MBB5296931.1 putative membrane protein [Deinococcus metallilatus]QBY06702.1 DUF2243 domain-containing protein [Deinococcus metallilatus]GMA15170.1 membrane protein [Deinococcus metallilatus]